MRFGVVLPIQDTQEPLDVLLDQLRAEVRAADDAGFDAFFLPEFHQTRAGGVISPLLTGAALAEGTRRIRVGQAVVPGPLYHPVRLAEDVAMLSWLTRGRALLGVGVGHLPADFELYDVERGTRFGRIRDLLDVVDAAWSGEPFDVSGQHGRWRGHVTPAPFGNKRPEVVMGAHGPRGLALAGQRADLWLSDPQRHVDVVARLAGRVRSAAGAAGRQVRIGMFRDAWIGDSRAECEKLWLPHAMAVRSEPRSGRVGLMISPEGLSVPTLLDAAAEQDREVAVFPDGRASGTELSVLSSSYARALEQMATFKVPRYVRFVTEWPMSGTKIQKARLRQRIADELAAASITQAPCLTRPPAQA